MTVTAVIGTEITVTQQMYQILAHWTKNAKYSAKLITELDPSW
jgi:hypothetical protein